MIDESRWRSIKTISDIAPGTIIVNRARYSFSTLLHRSARYGITTRYAVVIEIFTGTKQLPVDDGRLTIHPVNVVKILHISGGIESGGIDYIREVHMFAQWNKIVE